MQHGSSLPKPTYDPATEECYVCSKCGGTGFFCLGLMDGKPYSHTGFTCYPCGGTGWIVSETRPAAVRVNPFGAAVGVVEQKTVDLNRIVRSDRKAIVRPEPVKQDWSKMSDVQMEELFRDKLSKDPQWVRKALVALYERQTIEEQQAGATLKHNGMGFTGADANILSSFARTVIENRYSLSAKQLAVCFKLLPKYAGQLVRVVKAK